MVEISSGNGMNDWPDTITEPSREPRTEARKENIV
jgi:hypothetical protein